MKSVWLVAWVSLCSLGLSSCFLITVPMKATGEIVEKSAYATRDLGGRGIRKLREPSEPRSAPYADPGMHDPADFGNDEYYGTGR